MLFHILRVDVQTDAWRGRVATDHQEALAEKPL